MKQRRVGIDVDGVLADILTPCLAVASRILDKELTVEHLRDFDLSSIVPQDRLCELWTEIGEPGVCRNLVPYSGAVEGMARLREVADVYIVTSYLRGAREWM
jgi:5'(3')-deoxyribonucleotidase